MEESDPDPALAGQSSSTAGDRVSREEAETECSGMEIAFAAWKRTGPSCNAHSLSKFPSEDKNMKVYVKRKAHDAGLNIFETPSRKKNVKILARAKDVEVDPSKAPSSMSLEIVVTDISQAMVNDDKTENASRNNQMQNTVSNLCTTQFEERKSVIAESPMEPTLSAFEVGRQRSGVELISSNVNCEEQVSTADLIQAEFRNVTVTPEVSKVEVAALIMTNEQVAASKDPSGVKPLTAESDQCPTNLRIEDASTSMECLQSEPKLLVPMASCANIHGDSQEASLIQLELENGTECHQANNVEFPGDIVTDDHVAVASNGDSKIDLITAECDQCPTTSVRIEEALTSTECLPPGAKHPVVGACGNMHGGLTKVDFFQSELENVTVHPESSKAVAAPVTMTDDQAVATNGHSEVEWVTVDINQWPPTCTSVIDQASALLKYLRSAAKGRAWIGSSGNAPAVLQEAGLIPSKFEAVSRFPESSKDVTAAFNVTTNQGAPLNGPSEIESVTAEVDQSAASSSGNEEASAPVEGMQCEAKLPDLLNSCMNVHGESQESSLIQLESENVSVLLETSKPVAAPFIVTDCQVSASNGHSKIELGTAQVDQSAILTVGIKETTAPVECIQCEAELPVPVDDTYENVQGKSKEAGQIQSDLEHAKVLLETRKLVAAADLVTDHQAAAASNGPSIIVLNTGEVDQCATSSLQTKQASASVEYMQSEAKLQVPMGLCVNDPCDSQEGLKSTVTNAEKLGGVSNAAVVSPVKPDLLAAPKAKRTPLTFRPLETSMVANHSAASGVSNTMVSPAGPVMSNVNSTVLLAKRSPLPPVAPVMSNANSPVLLAKRSPLPIPVLRPHSSNSENLQVSSLENLSKQQKSSGVSSPKKPKDNQLCEATGRQSVCQGKAGLEIIADINPEENSDPNKDGEESKSAVSEENVHLGNPRISGIRSARKGKPAKKEAPMTDIPVRHLNHTSFVQSETLETGGRSSRKLPDLYRDHEGVSSVRRPRSARKSYLCSKCMVLKKGHKCPLGGIGSKDGEGRLERQDSAVKVSGTSAANPHPPQSTHLKLRLRVKPPVKKC